MSPMSPMNSIDHWITIEEYKAQLDEALREYFVTSDAMEFMKSLLGRPCHP